MWWALSGIILNLILFYVYFRGPKHYIDCFAHAESFLPEKERNITQCQGAHYKFFVCCLGLGIVVPFMPLLFLINAISIFGFTDILDKKPPKDNTDEW